MNYSNVHKNFIKSKAILKTIRHFPTCFYRNSIKKLNFLNKVTYLFWNNFRSTSTPNFFEFYFSDRDFYNL